MNFLDRFRKEPGGPKRRSAAAELDAYARGESTPDFISDFEPQHRQAVRRNLYLTKAAITIQWLGHLKGASDDSTSLKSTMLLDEFEDLTFPPMRPEEQERLVEHIRKLMSLTIRLQKCVDNRGLGKNEVAAQMMGVSNDWLGLVFKEEDLLCRLSLLHCAPLCLVINKEIANIAKLIEGALNERRAD
jgi:hypothetical protein